MSEEARLREENARLWAELHERTAQQREVEYLRRLVGGMESSLSWRVTKPLRTAKAVAEKVRTKLAERAG